MEQIFINNIHIDKVRHLSGIDIPVTKAGNMRHLILTGKNGSGKTSLLQALRDYLEAASTGDYPIALKSNGLVVTFNVSEENLQSRFENGKYVLAYYSASRAFSAEEPKSIEKVKLKTTYGIDESPRNKFLKYMLDQKMVQALALSDGNKEKAKTLQKWFDQIQNILRQIYEDDSIELKFDEDTFQFIIYEKGREPFDFNEASDGFSAILDIVVDLMMRLQGQSAKRLLKYDKPGIVLIDEIENHLHLQMQRNVLKFLTELFPNVQFIVSTHSPFVLNSIDNVTIYDLENQTLVEDGLTNVSYSGIVDGYFQAQQLSDELTSKFTRYKEIVNKKKLEEEDFQEASYLEIYLDEIPDYLSLDIATEYKKLKLEFHSREDIE